MILHLLEPRQPANLRLNVLNQARDQFELDIALGALELVYIMRSRVQVRVKRDQCVEVAVA